MGSGNSPLSENFLRYFDVLFANTEELKDIVYGIRYRVYCEEFGYEPAELFPDHREIDDFDACSLHALVLHRSSGLPAGCARLVMCPTDNAEKLLPFEKFCGESLDRDFIEGLKLARTDYCEVSRLAVDARFRRRAGEKVTRYGEIEGLDCSKQEERTFSLITLACLLASTALGDLAGQSNAFAMMEPFLPRLLKRSGIYLQSAGSEIDYHGIRAPYFITSNSVLETMHPDLKDLYREIYSRLALGLAA